MNLLNLFSICLLSWLSLTFSDVVSKRVGQEKIYIDIESKFICFKRLNLTHQVGCQSKHSGNVGVLDWIQNKSDLAWVAAKGKNNPYIPVLQLKDFTASVMTSLNDSKRISGVIIVHTDDYLPPSGFSPESTCPNDQYGLYNSINVSSRYAGCSAQSWNPNNPGLNLLHQNFEFPILLLKNSTEVAHIKECIQKFGRSESNPSPTWPLCSAQIYSRMKAAKDSRTCMRRNAAFNILDTPVRYCDPPGSFNIFAPFYEFKLNQTLPPHSLTILASRMDALSLFNGDSPGADSTITGLTVLLSVVETLSHLKKSLQAKRKADRNVLFSLFNGESLDYIGSGRTAYDMKNGIFKPLIKGFKETDLPKLELDNIANFIELSQLAPYGSEANLWIHSDPLSKENRSIVESINQIFSILNSSSVPISVKRAPDNQPLPPASFQSFLRESLSIPGVVLTNHEKQFKNRYYQSFLDNYMNVGFNDSESPQRSDKIVKHLANVSSLVSQTIYTLLTDENDASIEANSSTIHDILYCFLVNSTCPYFAKYFTRGDLDLLKAFPTLPLYISSFINSPSVAGWWLRELITIILGDFLGEKKVNISADQCTEIQNNESGRTFVWIPLANSTNGTCVNSSVFLSVAISPVFINEEEPDWDLKYSTWTESYWEPQYARIFLQPGRVQEGITLLTGLLVTIFSFFIWSKLDRRS